MGLLFVACLNFCPSFGTPLMIKIRESLGVDKMFLGYLGAMGTVLGVIGYFIYYKWVYKFPMKKLIYFMIVFTAVTNLFYLYIPNQWILLTYNLIFGAFGGITFMTLLAFFVKIIPTGGEGFFYALVTSVNNFAARGGNFLGGYIYDKTNYNTTVIVSTVFTLFCLLLVPLLKIEDK
jgi:predicted MFS family arabinose efflux permease